ncbi:hypothetical protein [Symbioplanes lichenis]|uniref:hypothetical protein n=1 Tax=Symbioplanes lichenis TaxID=1629072 RepID=UPI002739D15A|nr:hypothetical protein [Actinoplanes lichenis]
MAGKAVRAWPYRRAAGGIVTASNWILNPGSDDEREAPASLPDWDYQTRLRLRRRMTIDAVACRAATGLVVGHPLAISVRWHATPSLLRGAVAWVPLRDDVHEYDVDFDIAGERLGGVVHVETMIVLAAAGERRPAVAHLAGSSLWNDVLDIRLQGDAPLFPIALIPFSGSSLPHRAAWFLELGADLTASALGAIQLLVNQEHRRIADAVAKAASPNDVDRAVLSALRSDIVRTMLERALGEEEFSMAEDYGKDTLGSVLQGLVRTYLPDHLEDDLLEIRRIRSADPPLFAAMTQAATEFLAEER